ncbi:glucose-6-phosphate isomerase [Myroides sp. LJL116]
MLKNINPSTTSAWSELRKHFGDMEFIQMQDLFALDSERTQKFHLQMDSFLLDYSKNKITEQTLDLLIQLADQVGLKDAIEKMFNGSKINVTEDRAVLHTALRDFSGICDVTVDGENVVEDVCEARQKIKEFTQSVLSGEYKSSTGKKFTDVVNLGIGGSDLGPKMIVEALANYRNDLGVHYISNIDDDYLYSVLKGLNPETTLILIVSKTFTTQETIANAQKLKNWLESNLQGDISAHYVGVSADIQQAIDFGVKQENIFPMWDYIGGRFSLWSSVGLSISLAVGYDNFESLLKGAYKMDQHFRNADFRENMPVIMGLLSVWYNNFYNYETEGVVPYSELLSKFPAHLQQMIMESNGKDKNRDGFPVNYQTGTLIWGEVGVSAQHAFFQLFHQGTKVVPVDFIGFIAPFYAENSNHDILMSNFFGQTEALLNGKRGHKVDESELEMLKYFRDFEGNKPSNTLLIDALTPENLGMLIALYEHKTYVQGIIWNIYSFDQFGVEYGKVLAKNIQEEIKSKVVGKHDGSTEFLLNYYLKR